MKNSLGKSSIEYKKYWSRIIFSGRGNAPKTFASDQEAITYVSETSGAIGVISKDAKVDNAKVSVKTPK